MNLKQVSVFTAVCVLLLGILACTIPIGNPPSPDVEVTIVTKLASPLPTNTKSITATSLPTLDPDDPLTFGGAATATSTFAPTKTPTNTPLPPLPDFDDTISFGVGGGGGQCPGLDQTPNFVNLSQHGQAITTCFWLSGFDLAQPFQISLSQANGSGDRLCFAKSLLGFT